ncbi:MAG: hypothetical protein M1834_008229 [Cirrosporium novae-zelandiae]|nr:MAG: hypothetical protein M1834_008229 [Cirrosporium novae-zelandiae]
MQSYLPLLNASSSNNSIASLYRGVINLQSRYINTSPFCNAFQPPPESGIAAQSGNSDTVSPPYDSQIVFECKYELDSLAAFLEIAAHYYNATQDTLFFKQYQWADAVQTILNVFNAMMIGTYAENGTVNISPYKFLRQTTSGTETLSNSGNGNPVQADTGLSRSTFRPSDDTTIFQLFIPANMMFTRYLESTSTIMQKIGKGNLASQMLKLASNVRAAISAHGIVKDPNYGSIYAYEVDGFGSSNTMDDANIPSLLSIPFFGYLDINNTVYQNTRKVLLSKNNPYFMRGPVINAVGGPHHGPGYAWPMASIVRILTSNNDTEITSSLEEILSSTNGLGLIHESINTFNQSDYTRQWFSWANGLFGQMILDLESRKPHLLQQSFQ